MVKVEPPGGVATRGTPAFATWNRTKCSVVLDLDSDAGRGRLDELLAGADVLVHDLTPSWATALRLDGASLGSQHPTLVVCGVTGYPIGHPDEDLPASDTLAGRSAADVLDELTARGVPATRVGLDQMETFLDDPATWSSGLAARYSHPEWGDVEQIGSMWNFGDLTTRFERPSPLIGQHTVEILAELGFDAERERLAAGVRRCRHERDRRPAMTGWSN